MPWRAFKKLFWHLSRDSRNASDLELLRSHALHGAIWLVLTELALIASDYPASRLFNVLTGQGGGLFGLPRTTAIIVIVVSAVAVRLLLSLINHQMSWHRNSFEHKLWKVLMTTGDRHLVALDNSWHTRYGTGEKENLLAKNYQRLWRVIDELIFSVLPNSIMAGLTLVGLALLNWRFAVLAFVMIAAYLAIVQYNRPRQGVLTSEYRAEMKLAEEHSSETTNVIYEVKSLGLERQRNLRLEELTEQLYRSELWRHRKWSWLLTRQDWILAVAFGATVIVGAASYDSGTSLGGVVLGTGWIARISNNLFRLTEFQHAMNRGGPALDELNNFFATEPEIASPPDAVKDAGLRGEIELDGVSFGYPGKSDHQVKDVSLHIPANSFAAIVGATGSGKSTILSLILRLYDPCTGVVTIDGQDVRRFDLNWLRQEMVSYVSQNARLFNGSIYDNIAIGRPSASAEEVLAAARKAYVWVPEFAADTERFPDGLETLIGENGIRISGGERARIAIARAWVRQPRILMFDEATAALDNITERAIKEELDELTSRRACTVVAIAHRLTTVQRADVIFCLKDGRIVESGSHDELMARKGYYWSLWQSGQL